MPLLSSPGIDHVLSETRYHKSYFFPEYTICGERMQHENRITALLVSEGVREFGFVDQSRYDKIAPLGYGLQDLLPSARSALVYIKPLSVSVVTHFPETYSGPEYHAYVREKRKINTQLRRIGEQLVDIFCDWGFNTQVIPKGSHNYRGAVSLKHCAVYAGLGVLGKNSLLINPHYGPCLRIGAVITEYLPTECGAPLKEHVCNFCHRCITACPSGALHIPRESEQYHISVETCHAWYCIMRGISYQVKDADVNCGLCMKACPVGKE